MSVSSCLCMFSSHNGVQHLRATGLSILSVHKREDKMIIIPFLHILSRLIFHMLTHAMHLRWFPFIIGIRRGILIFLFVTFVRIRQPHSLLCTLHMRVSEPACKHVCVCVGGGEWVHDRVYRGTLAALGIWRRQVEAEDF